MVPAITGTRLSPKLVSIARAALLNKRDPYSPSGSTRPANLPTRDKSPHELGRQTDYGKRAVWPEMRSLIGATQLLAETLIGCGT
jgi:hypothetical protein